MNIERIKKQLAAPTTIAGLVYEVERLRAACVMAREELVFGGDWEAAKARLTTALGE